MRNLCPNCAVELVEDHGRYDCPACHRTILDGDQGEPSRMEHTPQLRCDICGEPASKHHKCMDEGY